MPVSKQFPYGLAVRIPGFHPCGLGSTPLMGKLAPLWFPPVYFQWSQHSPLHNPDLTPATHMESEPCGQKPMLVSKQFPSGLLVFTLGSTSGMERQAPLCFRPRKASASYCGRSFFWQQSGYRNIVGWGSALQLHPFDSSDGRAEDCRKIVGNP